jgi:hypothetical protein
VEVCHHAARTQLGVMGLLVLMIVVMVVMVAIYNKGVTKAYTV